MQSDGSRRSAGGAEFAPRGRAPSGVAQPLSCLALCLLAAGCGSIGQTTGLSAQARGDVSIAFESIDGLPLIFQKSCATSTRKRRRCALRWCRPAALSSYRLRGYLAAHPKGHDRDRLAWTSTR